MYTFRLKPHKLKWSCSWACSLFFSHHHRAFPMVLQWTPVWSHDRTNHIMDKPSHNHLKHCLIKLWLQIPTMDRDLRSLVDYSFINRNFYRKNNTKSKLFIVSVAVQGLTPFKGFFLQARDVASNNWVGEWLPTANTTIHPECASITHADPKDKQQATFVWIAPHNVPPGQVYFT